MQSPQVATCGLCNKKRGEENEKMKNNESFDIIVTGICE